MLHKLCSRCLQVSSKSILPNTQRRFATKEHLDFIKEVKMKSKIERPEGLRRKTDQERVGIGGYLLLAIPITTFGLGVWQVQRKQWKEGLIKSLEENMYRKAVPLPEK